MNNLLKEWSAALKLKINKKQKPFGEKKPGIIFQINFFFKTIIHFKEFIHKKKEQKKFE